MLRRKSKTQFLNQERNTLNASRSLKRRERSCAFEDLSLRWGTTKINLRTCVLQRNMPIFEHKKKILITLVQGEMIGFILENTLVTWFILANIVLAGSESVLETLSTGQILHSQLAEYFG